MKGNKMKITYNKNPLWTTVELDEQEKRELWYKIKVKEMEELLFDAYFHLREKDKHFNLESARKAVEPDYYLGVTDNEKSDIDKRCDEMLEYYLAELQANHVGDCTCVACSCMKCHAEDLLGINTTKGLGKHSAYKINAAFGNKNEKTIEEALEFLNNYNPIKGDAWSKFSQEEFDKHVPRWTAEAKLAYDWLLKYKNEKLNN